MNLQHLQLQLPTLVLVACDLSVVQARIAAEAAKRLKLSFFAASSSKAELDIILQEHNCIVCIDAANWTDGALVELATGLAFSGRESRSLIACGPVTGAVRAHLESAGLLRAVSAPLDLCELTAALLVSIERVRRFDPAKPLTDQTKRQLALPVNLPGNGRFAHLSQLLYKVVARRNARQGLFPSGLFSDPVWDILLSLAQARIEGRSTQASNIGMEACIPPSTALRRVKDLEVAGLVDRWGDPNDRRRDFVRLSDEGLKVFSEYAEKVCAAGLD